MCINRPLPATAFCLKLLSSPRAGLKGLCAESARAVTGRWCLHSEVGLFSASARFVYENGRNSEKKSQNIVLKAENESSLRGYKQVIDKIWGRMAK